VVLVESRKAAPDILPRGYILNGKAYHDPCRNGPSTDTLVDKPHALGYGKSAFGTGFTELLAMSATRPLLVPPESCFSFFTAFKRARSRRYRIPEKGRA
jgi:hypothetical protein